VISDAEVLADRQFPCDDQCMSTPQGEAVPGTLESGPTASGMAAVSGQQVFSVVVADDAAGIRALMSTLLSLEPDFDVVGQASDGAEAVDLVSKLRPDLLVIDVTMPVMSGLEAIQAVRVCSPSTRVVVLTGERRALPDGARAQIEKGTPNDVLIDTLRGVCRAG
jgi:DNA-binding NarL/FixJ family response regulator